MCPVCLDSSFSTKSAYQALLPDSSTRHLYSVWPSIQNRNYFLLPENTHEISHLYVKRARLLQVTKTCGKFEPHLPVPKIRYLTFVILILKFLLTAWKYSYLLWGLQNWNPEPVLSDTRQGLCIRWDGGGIFWRYLKTNIAFLFNWFKGHDCLLITKLAKKL